MQNAMRRTLGVGGATAVAIGATLALAGVASAHNHDISASCDSNVPTLHIGLAAYNAGVTNTITATAEDGSYLKTTVGPKTTQTITLNAYAFSKGTFQAVIPAPETDAGAKVYTFTVAVVAGDGSAYSFTQKVSTDLPCAPPTVPPTVPPSTVPPTTVPPSNSQTSTPPAPTTTSAKPVAAVASDKTTPGGLAYTGFSAQVPLIIAGVLLVVGAGALFGMRFAAKRRRPQS